MSVLATCPDWQQPVVERIGYLTDVIRAYNDTEQRIRLRETANGGLRFNALCMDDRESAQARALLWAKQADVIFVPWWPDAQVLPAAVSIGETTLDIDPENRDFTELKRLLVWRDAHTWEIAFIDAVNTGSVELAVGLTAGFSAGSLVVPLKPCRLALSQTVTNPNTTLAEIEVDCSAETDETPEYTGTTPTQYEGFDLLEVTPNNTGDGASDYERNAILLDSPTSIRAMDDHSGIATRSGSFQWFADGRDEIAALKCFIHRRKGRAVPFWAPTYCADLPLSAAATGTSFTIKSIDYTANQFPDIARRHIAFITPGGAITPRKITNAVNNGNGTETITISSALPAGGFPASTLVSFLTLVRLAEDDIDVSWSTCALAEATLPITEITREVPA